MKIIIVTGTPGTGKTTLAKALSKKLNYKYLDVNKLIKKYYISEGYDKRRKTKIIDIKKLNRLLIKEINDFKKQAKSHNNKKTNKKLTLKNKINKKIKNGIIIDSHLSHYLPKKYVDLCIVTKCSLKTLEKRLKKKKYSKEKVRENLDAEIFDVCYNEAKENRHKTKTIDTTKGIKINNIIKELNLK